MRWRGRSSILALGSAVSAVLALAASAWACVPMANVEVTPARVQAGQEVVVSGIRFLSFEPVVIRLDSLDGPVLATVPMGPTANTLFKTSVTIPPGTRPGPAVLIVTQEATPGYVTVGWGIPARTVVTVTGPDGQIPLQAAPTALDRPAELARATASTASVLLVGLGVAAVALFAAAAVTFAAGRRSSHAAAPVSEVAR